MKHFLLLSALLLFLGCSNGNVGLSGKVTFSDDGSPLTAGTVNFESATHLCRGAVKQDGSYTVGAIKENDGLPAGSYKISITEATVEKGYDKNNMPIFENLIDEKYTSGATSGLSLEVTPSVHKFDFKVERPAAKK